MTKKDSLLNRAAEEGEHSAIYCKLTFDAACLLCLRHWQAPHYIVKLRFCKSLKPRFKQ